MVKQNNAFSGKQWAVIVGLMLIVAIASVAISAGITGNTIKQSNNVLGRYTLYTKAEIDNKFKSVATNQGVLSMLNKCTYDVGSSYTNVLCDDVCKEKKKVCLFGFVSINYQRHVGEATLENYATFPLKCSQTSDEAIQGLEFGPPEGGDADTLCYCC